MQKKKLLILSAALGVMLIVIYFVFGKNHQKHTLEPETPPPIISSNITTVSVCPNGRIQPFDFSVSDETDTKENITVIKSFHENHLVSLLATDSSGARATKFFLANITDENPPIIELKEDYLTTTIGSPLDFPDPKVSDNCDEVSLEKSGKIDWDTPGTYTITYSSKDSSGNSASRELAVTVFPENHGVIYLTFDDGPGAYTDYLLDILKKHNVKATFFVTCSGSDDIIKREYDEGHTVALHTCSHDYSYLYSSVDAYFSDLENVRSRVERITGHSPTLIRFPGGSSNTVSAAYDGGSHIMTRLASEVENRGYTYFDWNISSGDAGGAYSSDAVYGNVMNSLVYDGNSVILQHDIKNYSVDAVERIIVSAKAAGYTFAPLTSGSPTAHHGINN